MDDQVRYYKSKLQYEIDPWDLNDGYPVKGLEPVQPTGSCGCS